MIKQSQSNPIRASYKNTLLPSFFATWLTGKPLEGQAPLLKLNWFSYTFGVVTLFLCSLSSGFLFFYIDNASYWLLAASWFGLIFSSRRMAAVVLHQAVHNRLSGREKIDFLIGEFVTILMFTQDYMSYKHDHCVIHHGPDTFATRHDPIVKFFTNFGIKPAKSKLSIYRSFFFNIFSPLFHVSFFISRAAYNISFVRPIRTLFVLTYLASLYIIASIIGQPLFILLLVFGIPLIIGYQISAFIEICSEHAWFDTEIKTMEEMRKDPYFYADISWGRFCGEPYPDNGGLAKTWWYIKHFIYHLPVRCLILVGDLPQHDFHHRKPLFTQWVYAKYERQKHASNLSNGEPEYYDIWGLHNAIEHVFNTLSTKSQEEYNKIFNEVKST